MIVNNFIDGAGKTQSQNVQLDSTLNMYLENSTLPSAKAPKALYGAFGTQLFKDFSNIGPVRGQITVGSYAYVISAGEVWQLDNLGNWAHPGDVADDSLPVRMVANATQIFIATAGFGFRIDVLTGVVTAVPAPPWTSLADCAFLHGYFIGLDDDGSLTGGQFFISSPNDCLTWDPLDFSTVPSNADKLRALATSHDELYVFGTRIIQPFYDSGNADFPLLPNQSGTMETGTTAKASVCAVGIGAESNDNALFFLAETANGWAQVMKLSGYTPVRVTTNALEALFQTYTRITETSAWTFQENGHQFLQIDFPEASWRYDSTTDRWAQVGWFNAITGLIEAHRGANHCFWQGKHLVGDRGKGIIWEMADTIYSDSDPDDTAAVVPMISSRECLLPSKGTKYMQINSVELLGETGVGYGPDETGPAWNPEVEIAFSGDAGHNYQSPRVVTAGMTGEYDARMRITGCGSFRQPAIKVSCSAPVKRVWYGLDIEIRAGIS